MIVGHLPDQQQSQPHSFGLGGDKRLTQVPGHGGMRPGAGIGDFQQHLPGQESVPQFNHSAPSRCFDGIERQIQDRCLQGLRVSQHLSRTRGRLCSQDDPAMLAGGFDEGNDPGEQGRAEIKAGSRRSGFPSDNRPRTCISSSDS